MATMRYHDGQDVQLGDIARFGDEDTCRVVVLIDQQLALEGYIADEWAYLGGGCVLLTGASGLVHYPADALGDDADVSLLERA
ncbi:hypothetical protein ACI2IY_18435 [Lysobacter enzymogenes]|uniref:hypothetical protein n=1 Tax=Lysobacter enzymogenes TaxID=69 RepID=UPI0038506ADF